MRVSPHVLIVAVLMALLAGCESGGSSVRNIETVYCFENLRKSGTTDEWAAIKPILDRHSARAVTATSTNRRTIGTFELSTMEAKVVLPTLQHAEKIQAELEALRARAGRGDRIEVYLTQMAAGYKTNFVAATASVTVSGVATRGNRVRLFASRAEDPVEVVANASGVWVARLNVVPEANWVYGVSEDVAGRVPNRYFRINIATKVQERLEESEFLAAYPDAFKPKGSTTRTSEAKPRAATAPTRATDDRLLREQRRKEEEELRRKRAEDDRRRSDPAPRDR